MRYVIRNLLWAGAGAVVAWGAMYFWGYGVPRNPSGPLAASIGAPRPASAGAPALHSEPDAGAQPPIDSEPAAAGAAVEIVADPPPETAPVAVPAAPTRPAVVWFPPNDLPVGQTDLPNRRSGDAGGSRPAAELLEGTRITCDFGAGVNTGMRFGDSLSVGAGAQWQGSLMVYDLLEPSIGRARLSGTLGGAGSPTGEAKVQLMAIGSRVYFMGLQQNGTYMITTIYDELDNMDRHVAVMSRHENGFFAYATQWLGVCY